MLSELNESDCNFLVNCINYTMTNGDYKFVFEVDRARKILALIDDKLEQLEEARDVFIGGF